MLNERGVCVLDFGVAKVLATAADSTATHATTGSGQIVGTPRYMSPEQCLGQRVGARSDLYSLGVVLYEMLAGRPPFIDALPSAVLVKQATASAPPLPQMRPDIPKYLALAVHTLLAKRPEDRPRTAAAARALLERSLVRPQREVPEVDPFSSTMAVVAKRSSIIFRLAAPLATVIFFGALLFVWGGSSESVPKPADLVTAADQSATAYASLGTPRNGQGKLIPTPAVARGSMISDSESPAAAPLDFDRARKIAARVSRDVSDVQILQTRFGAFLVGINEQPKTGDSQFFVMEKRSGAFRLLARGQLDNKNFRGGEWTADRVDADGDNYDEVLFTGLGRSGRTYHHRFVLYVPKERHTYVLEVETKGRNTPPKAVWSKNLLSANGAYYRRLLRARANMAIAGTRNR